MERARKTVIIGTALRMEVRDLLHAFELAVPHTKGRTFSERYAHQWVMALCIIDRAIIDSERGGPLLKQLAEEALTPRGDDTITVGPVG